MKKIIENLIVLTVLLSYGLTVFLSCDSMNDIHQKYLDAGERVYLGMTDSITAYSGRNRVKLVWYANADPKVETTVIYCDTRKDSIEKPFTRIKEGLQKDSVIIQGLDEDIHLFVLFNKNSRGERSLKTTVQERSYGENYERFLVNRFVKNAMYSNGSLKIEWSGIAVTDVGVSLDYTDTNGNAKTLPVSGTEPVTTISDFKKGGSLWYQTMYKPNATAIDTFFVAKQKIIVIDDSYSFLLPALTPAPVPVTFTPKANSGVHSITIADGPKAGQAAVLIPLSSYFQVEYNMTANGGGSRVNNYTMLIDFKLQGTSQFYSFLQTTLANNDDVEFFTSPTRNLLGAAAYNVSASPARDVWTRLVIVKSGVNLTYYLNGTKYSVNYATDPSNPSYTHAVDDRYTLDPAGTLVCADNDGDDGPMVVSAVAFWDRALTDAEVTGLGGL